MHENGRGFRESGRGFKNFARTPRAFRLIEPPIDNPGSAPGVNHTHSCSAWAENITNVCTTC